MKHLKSISFIFFVLVLAACSSSTSTNTDNDKLSTSNNFASADEGNNVDTINKISFDTAIAYVQHLIEVFPNTLTKDKFPISGYFSRNYKDSAFFYKDGTHQNVNMIQYCLSTNGKNYLFFALCKTDSANENGIKLTDDMRSIRSRRNDTLFEGNQSVLTLKEVEGKLEDYAIFPKDTVTYNTIRQREVKTLGENFLKAFTLPNSTESLNKFAYAVIQHHEMDSLMRQSLEADNDSIIGFRCYLGYNPVDTINRIRLIVFAVGADGKNLCKKSNGKTDYFILDKAWP